MAGITNKNRVIIAYEPISAIGTGKPFPILKAEKINLKIKKLLGKKQIVLYGGSVNQKNVTSFIEGAGFQGVLVGAVSLDAKGFTQIINKIKTLK